MLTEMIGWMYTLNGARGARLTSRDPGGPQNLFEIFGTAKLNVKFGIAKLMAKFGTAKLNVKFGIAKLMAKFGTAKLIAKFGTPKLMAKFDTAKLMAKFGTTKLEGTQNNFTSVASYYQNPPLPISAVVVQLAFCH
ncbi:hypothetical protein AVEN_111579-1 [Araneus ventricosus]|uniref:Uncharacterized protein n=1 Tax=Araneus ventricosus TaxID=182803 RepID=A0A4Y2T0L6_ARAVE|nr:hypothetical protein AVEN_259282-1 [Araneus ventricosus]GBN92969.1 hypothetical protein AVEN_111579-1 [Araneus ventricosus]